MISWKFYTSRRRIDPARWVQSRNITSYHQFVRCLKALGVSPPPEDSFNDLFVSSAKPSAKESAAKITKQTAVKKSAAKKVKSLSKTKKLLSKN